MSSVSRIPLAKSFCCCLSLETGCKIIGFLELIICSVAFFFVTYFAVQIAHQQPQKTPHHDLIVAAVLYIDLYMLFEAILAAYLLFGVYKGRRNYIRAWVLIQLALLVLAVFSDFLIVVFVLFANFEPTGLQIPEEILGTVLHAYCVWVVHSYYVSISGREALIDA